ncbi:YpmS family protein [Thermolongibacillus altinsuensis]|nr:YpmS family protein [Thermolongibacillus altinsuensis]GMB09635.1 hypothetical protein B1no1_23450 [Thermolongibacillus altinsuensis]
MKWKKLFFGLLFINLSALTLVLFLLFQPAKTPSVNVEEAKGNAKEAQGAELIIHTTKQHLNTIINDYVKQKMKTGSLSYEIQLADQVYIKSQIPVFEKEMDLTVTFIPNVTEQGNIELSNPTISLGQLKLPVQYVLKYMQKNASLPDWVKVDPKNERVYVLLNEVNIKKGYNVRAERFDLEKDEIVFKVIATIK